jgi:dihydroorotate dehydrogenase electron transfer subunit
MDAAPTNAADREAPLVAHEPLDAGYVLLSFRHPEVAAHARPGQFVMIKAGSSPEPPLRRPFSILRVDRQRDEFSLFLKAVGPGSRALARLALGETARCLGPLGRPFAPPEAGHEALLVAGGYGVAPFLFLCAEQAPQRAALRVFYGGRSVRDLQLRAAFEALGVPLVAATEDGSLGVKGLVSAPLEQHLSAGGGPFALYACGPDAMLHAIARIAERRGLKAQVSLDPWMGCGLGTCLGCVVRIQERGEPQPRYRCACTEGPVFDAACVVWPGEASSSAHRAEAGA